MINIKIIIIQSQNMPAFTLFLSDFTEVINAFSFNLFRRVVNSDKKSESYFLFNKTLKKEWKASYTRYI